MNLLDLIKELGASFQAQDDQATRMFWTLQSSGKHVYAGTVPPSEVARRRAANRRARATRRGNTHRARITPQRARQRAHRAAQVAARSSWAARR